ncbi:DNA polymerase III subunit alpha [bacterium]|nr:MAG: DNA polymerase III subunit alpha [bacterium]
MSKCPCGFCHLHVHSEYSLLDGANRIKDMAKRAAALDMPALAITDHGVMYGAVDHYTACKAEGIKPIIGVEAYVAPRKHTDKDSQLDSQKQTRHLTLWAKNKKGYENMVKLTSTAHLKGFYYKARVDHELLAQHAEGIICGSACLGGEVPQLIMAKKFDEAVERAEMYRDMFGKENYFLELMDHDLTGQSEVNDRLIDIHHKTGIPLICSNDAHYLRREDEEMHKILVCIGTNTTVQSAALHYGPNFYLKDKEEMWDKFKHVPSALENTIRIADMVDLELDLKTTHFPNYDVPDGHDKTSYLRYLCKQRFDKRYPPGHPRRAEAIPRMEYELNVIIDKGYPGYFLVVQDFINWSKERGILVGCRGSAAGCLVSYVLGITNLDPLPYGLLFERFLNPERVSMPDIDVDFPDKRRDEVMKYVTDKYGKDKVAQIITFGTLAARAAVKDTARATGLELKLADQVAKLIPAIPSQPITIKRAIAEVKELRDLYESDSTVRTLLDRAQNIEGMTRHSSRHACGVVIGDAPLDTMVPLEEKDGLVVTQYHAKAVEKIGLVKMDFLGLTNNSVIDESLTLIKERYGDDIDLETLALDDKKVYDMMGKGDGIAVFQMEGSGMRNLLREMKPENLEHIIAQISLYRPGPMEDIPIYIKGRHGGEVKYPHPKLEPILKETYGMLLYQEQVMRAAQELAGFTGGQADELRGAMAKKKADLMAKLKPLFIDGCVKNKIRREDATEIFDKMETFAKYAFNKCAFAKTKVYLPDGSSMTLAKAFVDQPTELMAMWPDGEVRPHKVARIVKTGRKALLKITTQKGRVIKITPEHRLLSTEGYVEAQNMRVGMELMTMPHFWRGLPEQAREARRENMRRVNKHPERQKWAGEQSVRMKAYQAARPLEDKQAHMKRMHELHPDLTRAGVAAMHDRVKWLIANDPEWRQNWTQKSLANVRACYDTGPGWGRCSIASNGMWCVSQNERGMCEWLISQNIKFEMHRVLPEGRICDFYFAGIYWEMDGLDRADSYFEEKYGDLPYVVVTPEDFKFKVEHHLQLAHAQNGDPIVSIEECGEGMTYDVEMAPDGPLNYIANGIVSHNSHAAYYGLVSYWTGYLKVNYTSEFLACNMTSRLDAKPKLLPVIDDARKHGIDVLPPDVNESNQDFTVVGVPKNSPIRFGLLAIKGIGENPVNAILEARREGGKFVSLHDFCERVPLRGCNKSCIETLIKSGAFDSIHPNRKAMLDGLEGAISSGQRAQADALTGQTSMFGEPSSEAGRPKTMGNLADCEDYSRGERLSWEKEYIGLYVSDHPLTPFREYLETAGIPLSKITEEKMLADGARVTVGGLVTTMQKRVDKNGNTWASLTLEDLTGQIDVLAFAKTYEKCGENISEDAKLLITGRLSADSRGGFGGGGGEDSDDDVRFKIMADDIQIIPEDAENSSNKRAKPLEDRIAGINEKAEKAAERAASGTGWNGGNGGGAKGHKILESLGKSGNGSNGHSNGNGNGSNGHSNGGGISINRSSTATMVLPPQDATPPPAFRPSSPPPSFDDGPASISHAFEVPYEASGDVHLHIPANLATQTVINKLYSVVRRHRGAKQVWIHLDNGHEMVQMKVSANFWVDATQQFCEDVAALLGDENIVPPED